MTVIKVRDMRYKGEVIFDGEFIEKLPTQNEPVRRHVGDFTEVTISHKPAKKKLLGGKTEERWEALIHCGMFISLWVDAEHKPQLDELVAALEKARDTKV